MAKFICLTCGWKGDKVEDHESETSDIRLLKPNYPRIAKSKSSPEQPEKDTELEGFKKVVTELVEDVAKNTEAIETLQKEAKTKTDKP